MKSQIISRISSDLKIFPFNGEANCDYCNRLLYSAISEWLKMSTFDLTNERNDNIKSKIYLRNRGKEILSNMLEVFPESYDYFYKGSDEEAKHPINIIRERMIASGELIETLEGISISNSEIMINNSAFIRICEISNQNNLSSGITKIRRDDKLVGKTVPNLYKDNLFDTIFKKIEWNKIEDVSLFEYNNPFSIKSPYKSWEKTINLEENTMYISRIKVFATLYDYYWIKKSGSNIYISKLDDIMVEFKEYRRFILWQRSKCDNKVQALFCNKKTHVKLKLMAKLPYNEQLTLDAYCWPEKSIQSGIEYTIRIELWEFIKGILKSLKFDIKEKYDGIC